CAAHRWLKASSTRSRSRVPPRNEGTGDLLRAYWSDMAIAQRNEPTPRKPLRLWPGVLAAVILVLVRFVVPSIVLGAGGIAILGGVAAGLAVVVWWGFFSRAPWSERIGAIVVMAGALLATSRIVHASIANGMMG